MHEWAEERQQIREFLQPRCANFGEYEFWDDFFDDLTDMFDGLFDDLFLNDPVLWEHYYSADNTADQHGAYVNHEKFLAEAYERGWTE